MSNDVPLSTEPVRRKPSIVFGAKLVQVGMNEAGKNEFLLVVTQGEEITVTGVTEEVARFLGKHLYKRVFLTVEIDE